MESDDDADTQTAWTSLHWTALKVVKRLKNHSEKAGAEAPAVRDGQPTPITESNAPGKGERREAVKFNLVASPATSDRRGM